MIGANGFNVKKVSKVDTNYIWVQPLYSFCFLIFGLG